MKTRSIFLLFTCVVSACTVTAQEVLKFGNFGEKATGSLSSGESTLRITTKNTRHCFFESDSYSFAYKLQEFPYDDCSRSTTAVKIDKFAMGSAGIMMRSGLNTDAANAHLEVNAMGDLLLFSRRVDGTFTTYKKAAKIEFPVEIKLVRQGDVFTGYYKGDSGQWVKAASLLAEVGTKQFIGFYGCSGTESQIGYTIDNEKEMNVSFSDWSFSYEENYIPEEKNYVDNAPVKTGTLLRDNFNDGSMSNEPESITNPIWKGIKYAEMPRESDGSRYWRKCGDGIYYLGDKKWADYQVSLDLSFDKESSREAQFSAQLRYQHISIYNKLLRFYNVGFRTGDKLFFEKHDADKITIREEVTIPDYRDGSRHNLVVKLLDTTYEVYYDGKLLIAGADEKQPITYGNMALNFSDVSMNTYELEVLSVDDPINGSDDNYLLDYFDVPIPEYLKKYGYPQENGK